MCAEAPPQLSATPYIRGVVSATMGCFSGDQGHPVFGARRRQRLNTPIVTCALRERVREPTHRDGRSEQATGPSCYDTYRCEQVRGRVQPSRNHCDLISRQTRRTSLDTHVQCPGLSPPASVCVLVAPAGTRNTLARRKGAGSVPSRDVHARARRGDDAG